MSRPKMLDLFCCEGGASEGYHRAGYDVYGVDRDKRGAYRFAFHHGDALAVLVILISGGSVRFTNPDGTTEDLKLSDFAAAHASPPCQRFSTITPDSAREDHPDLIVPVRWLFRMLTIPWVIENVEGAKHELDHPTKLCGSSFGLLVRRHRYFESNVWLVSLPCEHARQGRPIGVYGDHPQDDEEYRQPDGTRRGNKAKSLEQAQEAMGMPWATWRGVTEAIPPAFTEFIGLQLIEAEVAA